MIRFLATRIQQQLTQPLRRAFASKSSEGAHVVPKMPHARDEVVAPIMPKMPRPPEQQPQGTPKPPEPAQKVPTDKVPALEEHPHADRINNVGGAPINIL
jgi:hypothetical protein